MTHILVSLAVLCSASSAWADSIADAATRLRARLVETRRDLHMNPELSNRETRTAKLVADRLRAIGAEDVKTGVGGNGVVALIRGKKPGPVIAVRADMDALPIDETMNVPYRSKVKGVKHACGHDAHVAMALGVAEIFAGMKNDLAGTVKFIFQPAEEGAPPGEEGGADAMVKRGALENPRPREIYGMHVMPTLDVGELGVTSGAAMASSDHFIVTVRGKKSHGAWPHEGVDAIVAAAEMVSALQTIRSRRVDPTEPMVLTIGIFRGGNRFNILADEVLIEGTVRTLSAETRKKVLGLLDQILGNVARAHDASFSIAYSGPAPIVFNEPKLVDAVRPSLERAVGKAKVILQKPAMVAEDFAFYQQVIPGLFFNVGVRNRARGIVAMNHTAEFDLDEDALVVGVRTMATVVSDALVR